MYTAPLSFLASMSHLSTDSSEQVTASRRRCSVSPSKPDRSQPHEAVCTQTSELSRVCGSQKVTGTKTDN